MVQNRQSAAVPLEENDLEDFRKANILVISYLEQFNDTVAKFFISPPAAPQG
jgi:hypothetical protein